MNERYTYGYETGFNVENEYVNSLNEIMNGYNVQAKIISDIEVEKARLENKLANTLSEDEIRKSYEEYYANGSSMRSYDAFKADVLGDQENEKMQIRRDLEQNKNKYYGNLYYLIEVKQEARKEINQRKRELSLLLEERNLELSYLRLQRSRTEVQYDENRNVLNSEQLKDFNKKQDEIWLETRKIEHALKTLDEMYSTLEFTQEESALMMRGLNPQERSYYEEIVNDKEKTKQKVLNNDNDHDKDLDNDENKDKDDKDDDNDDDNDNDKDEELDEEIIKDDFDIELEKYNAMLAEYEKLLEEYNKELEKLYILEKAYDENKITYAEYEEYANYMKERYKFVLQKYNEVYAFYMRLKELLEEINKYDSLSVEELEQKLKELENEFRSEYQFRVHGQNGMEYNDDDFIDEYNNNVRKIKQAIARKKNKYASLSTEELERMLEKLENEFRSEYQFRVHEQNGMEYNDDDFIENYNKKKKAITDELKRRNRTIREPIPPQEPQFVYEKEEIIEEEKSFEYNNLKAFIDKIAGPYEYKKMDSFIYRNKDIKCFNWPSKSERTILDKPMKLIKFGLTGVILGGSKIYAKAAYRKQDVQERIEYCLKQIENLTDKEIEVIGKLTATKMHDYQSLLPKVAWEALYKRLAKITYSQTNLANQKLKVYLIGIVESYKKALSIQTKLNNPNITNEEKIKLNSEISEISTKLCKDIIDYENLFKETDNALNASGLYGMQENFRAKGNINIGGRYAKFNDSPEARGVGGILGRKIQTAIRNGDGIAAAKNFIHDQQIEIENTETKKTLRNKFGETSVGIYNYSPLVRQADYSEDTYIKDVLQTIVLVSNIITMVNTAAMQDALNKANATIQAQNAQIQQLNQDITQLKSLTANYSNDPDKYLETYYNVLKNEIGGMQGTSEYLGQLAQSNGTTGVISSSNGADYKLFDVHSHNFYGNLERDIDVIFNDPSLSIQDKIVEMGKLYEDGANELVRQASIHSNKVQNQITTYGNNFDYTAVQSILDTVAKVNPSVLSNTVNEYVEAAILINNMQALSYINTINVNTDLTSIIVGLSAFITDAELDYYRKMKKDHPEKFASNEIEEIKKAFSSVEIDEHEKAKNEYEKAKEDWDSKGFFYRLTHREEKPKRIDYDKEELEKGRSL